MPGKSVKLVDTLTVLKNTNILVKNFQFTRDGFLVTR